MKVISLIALIASTLVASTSVGEEELRHRLFNQFEQQLADLHDPLSAETSLYELSRIADQIANGTIFDNEVMWPDFLPLSGSVKSSEVSDLFDVCADVSFGRSNEPFPSACLSPDIFAAYIRRQASQFQHFNNNVWQHPIIDFAYNLSRKHGSAAALFLRSRRERNPDASISGFLLAREQAIARDHRTQRIAAEANIIFVAYRNSWTFEQTLNVFDEKVSGIIYHRNAPSEELVKLFILCSNELLAADTEGRDPSRQCLDYTR